MDLTLAKTIEGFSSYCKKINPDLIVIHGDRVETLAGAIVGSLNNILVAHIEGGELSGTVDELIRHSVTKLSHIHFVSNDEAAKRLLQMGEIKSSIFTIGSPDIDIMFSNDLPTLEEAKAYYEIPFKQFGVVMFHPVTTEFNEMNEYAAADRHKEIMDVFTQATKKKRQAEKDMALGHIFTQMEVNILVNGAMIVRMEKGL
jgi:UDP-N-acetylglucosamine 2-epimerase (hydrolysing)